MPTISVEKELLFAAIGKSFTDEEFCSLCMDFGIELDDITSAKKIAEKEKGVAAAIGLSDDVIYKIDVPANRQDILCLEGIAMALRIYLQMERVSKYHISPPAQDTHMVQKKSTLQVRPFVVSAILRDFHFDPQRYASFIDLQDKLHQNIGRQRTLVAIGTHDLDSIEGPFTYDALPPKDISFIALGEEKEMNVAELFHYYKNEKPNCHLKPYLHITENEKFHPVIYDKNGVILSLPPIINGEHSKIHLDTRNIYIESTGMDLTKLKIALNMLIAMFSRYCTQPFSVEECRVLRPDGKAVIYPDLAPVIFEAKVDYINNGIGINLSAERMAGLLSRMQMPTTIKDPNTLSVTVPPTRCDIMHPCDIMEDVAIAYGFNNIKKTVPTCHTVGRQQPLNKLTGLIRDVVSQVGFVEVMTFILINYDENFKFLNREDDGSCVTLLNPRLEMFNVVRTTLLPGLLKTLNRNLGQVNIPIRIFEASDVAIQDASQDVGARNVRRVGALYCANNSGLEEIHGLVHRIMLMNDIHFTAGVSSKKMYKVKDSKNPSLFPGRGADVFIKGQKVGYFGIIHPKVLAAFDIALPCSVLELDIEAFL